MDSVEQLNDLLPEDFEDEFEPQEDLTCEYCSGSGGNPWDDHITPCPKCDGEGHERWRT